MVTAHLGMKFVGHDTAAFLVLPHRRQVFGLSTERITRVKHDNLFPLPTIATLIAEAGDALSDVEQVHCVNSFSSHRHRLYPVEKYETDLMERQTALPPTRSRLHSTARLDPSSGAMPEYEMVHYTMLRHLLPMFPMAKVSLHHLDHEYCHARSSYDFSPFDRALVLTMDGSGDHGVFSRAYLGQAGKLRQIGWSSSSHRVSIDGVAASLSQPCSLGGIYSCFTAFLGFKPNSEEGKVEALAAWGRKIPGLYDALKSACRVSPDHHAIELHPELLDRALRRPLPPLGSENASADIAATIQSFTEDILVEYVSHLLRHTGANALCLSGGVFANVLVNMRLAELVENRVYIAPAMGDEGSAQGAASASYLAQKGERDDPRWLRELTMPYFGRSYDRRQVQDALSKHSAQINIDEPGDDLAANISRRIEAGQIGALFQGRSEFGPRALGNRSIIASPRETRIRDRINLRIKRRPNFQPVCPAILTDELTRLFPSAYPNKHMTCAFRMKPEFHDTLPAAIHVDGTSRVQFVDESDNALLYAILRQLQQTSGFGVALNTSFNIHGRAMVEDPLQAMTDFLDSELDFLAIEGLLVTRSQLRPHTLR